MEGVSTGPVCLSRHGGGGPTGVLGGPGGLPAGLLLAMALAQLCSAAGQLGPAAGGWDRHQHRSPGGARLLPPFSPPSFSLLPPSPCTRVIAFWMAILIPVKAN